jgi:hypothetical protein
MYITRRSHILLALVITREIREGWPPMSVETEANGDSRRVLMKGVLPWLVHWAHCAATRDFCPALDAQIGPVQNIFFFLTRETRDHPSLSIERDGWPLLSVETEPNRDSRSSYKRGPSVVGLLGSFLSVQEIFTLVQPSTNDFFPHR